jgi:phage-related protein
MAGNLKDHKFSIPNIRPKTAVNQVGKGGFSYLASPFMVVRSQLPSSIISLAVMKLRASIILTGKTSICITNNSTVPITITKPGYVFKILRTVQNVPKKFLDHMSGTDGLYEVRIEFEGNIYRIFCCFDKGNLVVLFNGFQKKSQKTPKKEIELALKLKEKYFKQKIKRNEQ